MNITSRKLHLIFEMKLGEATSSLVSEIFRVVEGTFNICYSFHTNINYL